MSVEIKKQVNLAPYTTLGIGGPADFMVAVKTKEDLIEVLNKPTFKDLPVTIIGGGSNVLVSDRGIKGLVIKNEIDDLSFSNDGDNVLVRAGAGVLLDDLIEKCVERELWGMENLSAIPGTVGASPVQNVGAYGVEVADVIVQVEVYDRTSGDFIILTKDECQFAYRDSIFKREGGANYVVVAVTYLLSLKPEPKLSYRDLSQYFETKKSPSLLSVRKAVIEIRSRKFPDWHKLGTAGSFFKNPLIDASTFTDLHSKYPEVVGFSDSSGMVKLSVGWILDKVCHLKGYRKDRVGTYESQALVLINYGSATAEELDEFAKYVSDEFCKVTGVELEREVRWLE